MERMLKTLLNDLALTTRRFYWERSCADDPIRRDQSLGSEFQSYDRICGSFSCQTTDGILAHSRYLENLSAMRVRQKQVEMTRLL